MLLWCLPHCWPINVRAGGNHEQDFGVSKQNHRWSTYSVLTLIALKFLLFFCMEGKSKHAICASMEEFNFILGNSYQECCTRFICDISLVMCLSSSRLCYFARWQLPRMGASLMLLWLGVFDANRLNFSGSYVEQTIVSWKGINWALTKSRPVMVSLYQSFESS